MNHYIKLLAFFIAGLVLFSACATTQDTRLNRADLENLQFPELNPYQIPEVEIFELDNGITFYLMEDDEVPLINLNMIVRAGSFMDPDDKVGLASITANVIRNGGSATYPENELNQLLEDRAARIEFGMGFTSGSVSLNALTDDFYDLLPVLLDVMMDPLLPQDKIDLAIRQQRSGISRRNDDAQSIGFREFGRLIYGKDSPQGRQVEHYTLDNINRDDLVAFHQKAYTGENLMIGLVGDFDASEIKSKLEEIFSIVPAGERNEIIMPEVDYEFESSIHFVDKRDVNQSVIVMGHIGGMRDNPDYAALQAMNEVLSGGFSGRLFQNVRSDQGLAYSVFGSYGSGAFAPGQFFAGVFTQSSSTAEAIEAVRREMINLQEEPVSQEELDDTRNAILNSLVFRFDSRARVLRQRMSNDYQGLPEDAFEQYIEELRELTPADIQRVAQQYMRPNEMKILVVGNGGEIGDQLEQFGDIQDVDIAIRRSPPGADLGDPIAGREWLKKMSDAILGSTTVNGYSYEGVGSQGPMEIKESATFRFPDAIRVTQELPQGTLTLNYADGSGSLSMMGQEQPLPPPLISMMREQIQRDYIYLASHASSVPVLKSDVSNDDVIVLLIGQDQGVTLKVDASTNLPYSISYEQMNMMTGQQMELTNIYEQWERVDGVQVARSVTIRSGGEVVGSTRYESFSFE